MKKTLFLLLFLVNIVLPQDFDPLEDVSFKIEKEYQKDHILLKIEPVLPDHFHIGANSLFQIKSDDKDLPLSNIKLPVPTGPEDFPYYAPGSVFQCQTPYPGKKQANEISMTISYQICSEGEEALCFPPVDKIIKTEIDQGQKKNKNQTDSGLLSQKTLGNRITEMLNQGSILVFLLVFLGGILTSLTPCVYPMIPITIGFIGARTENKKQGFKLSLFFTMGLSVTYAILGLAAARTGNVFGSFTQNPIVVYSIAALFIIMGFSMFGLFELQLPSSMMAKIQSKKKQGLGGAVFMGMITGFIGAPCVGPVLISLLAFVATTGGMLKGFLLLLTFGLGMSMLFLIIGTFTGALKAMPSSGSWMNGVKTFFGLLLFGAALYFISPYVSEKAFLLISGALITFSGITLYSGLEKENKAPLWRSLFILIISTGILLWSVGLIRVFGLMETPQTPTTGQSAVEHAKSSIPWIVNDTDKAFETAKKENKPILIDAYAEWCVACNELEEITYVDPEVQKALDQFVLLKYDFTQKEDWQDSIKKKYRIMGLPTVIFITPAGEEISRFTGFITPEEFLEHVQR